MDTNKPVLNPGKEHRSPNHWRDELLRDLALKTLPGTIRPNEAALLLFGDRSVASRAAQIVRRRAFSDHIYSLPTPSACSLPIAPRPLHVLSRLNSTQKVFPPLLSAEVSKDKLSLYEILAVVRKAEINGSPPHELLDLLAASGLAWQHCAELLFLEGLVSQPIDIITLEIVRRTRRFWDLYAQARARHRELVRSKEIVQYGGDWAALSSAEVQTALPEILLPDHCERREFLTNYFTATDHCSLDFYSMSRLPLVQHRFLPRFNPLIFGTPNGRLA